MAVDTTEQTATAIRPVSVPRFRPRISRRLTRRRDRLAPVPLHHLRPAALPEGLTRRQGCRSGRVAAQVKRGTRTVSTRRAKISRTCRFRSRVTFRVARRLGRGRLRVTVRWLGNAVLAPRTARAVTVRAGGG
jgi:hypothetical protein